MGPENGEMHTQSPGGAETSEVHFLTRPQGAEPRIPNKAAEEQAREESHSRRERSQVSEDGKGPALRPFPKGSGRQGLLDMSIRYSGLHTHPLRLRAASVTRGGDPRKPRLSLTSPC